MVESATCPATREQVIDLYFMEHRAKLIDLAAFLDRLDRSSSKAGKDDFRIAAFRRALAILSDGKPERARRVLELFSDHSTQPIAKAPMKGALGAAPLS
jgi:hypothetical protein